MKNVVRVATAENRGGTGCCGRSEGMFLGIERMSGDFGRGDSSDARVAEKHLKVCHLQGSSALTLLHESLGSCQVGQRTYFDDDRGR